MKDRRIVINFLLRFFITYFLLVGIYSLYLHATQQRGAVLSCDPMTEIVAKHTVGLSHMLGYPAYTEQHEDELSMKLYIDNIYSARIVEGCNAISVIILFLTFIIAFSGTLKATIFFGLIGSLIIYVVNIIRILGLSKLEMIYPEYQDISHDLVFPGIIYGTTFVLWIIWVNKFSHLKLRKK